MGGAKGASKSKAGASTAKSLTVAVAVAIWLGLLGFSLGRLAPANHALSFALFLSITAATGAVDEVLEFWQDFASDASWFEYAGALLFLGAPVVLLWVPLSLGRALARSGVEGVLLAAVLHGFSYVCVGKH